MEMVASKEEMLERQYTEEFGSGTALLLRLTEPWKGSSRVVLADSAFASVKSAHSLMQKRGLHFIGMVKTAHRSYPRAFLNAKLKEAERGQTEALGCDFSGTPLIAVGWKDKKIFTLVSTFGTTLPGKVHRVSHSVIYDEGTVTKTFRDVPRDAITTMYFEGSSTIDVHNHLRQGNLAVESHARHTWHGRFFQSWLGTIEVDAFLAYQHFTGGGMAHREFLCTVVQMLLNNLEGVGDQAPVLRPRRMSDISTVARNSSPTCDLVPLKSAVYFQSKRRRGSYMRVAASYDTSQGEASQGERAVGGGGDQKLKCTVCKSRARFYCTFCSKESADSTRGYVAICGPSTGRSCHRAHVLSTSQL